MDRVNLATDFIPNWSASVWINIQASVCVVVCMTTWIGLGWRRRNEQHLVQDRERLSITFVLITLIAFFTTRAIDVARAGKTIATARLLVSGELLSIACVVCTVILIRNHDEYSVLSRPEWKPGDLDRRVGERRRQVTE